MTWPNCNKDIVGCGLGILCQANTIINSLAPGKYGSDFKK